MRSLVVDCSTAIAWTMLDESSVLAVAALERLRAGGGVAPQIWWAELRNALLTAERRGRIPRAGTDAALAALDDLPIVPDCTPSGAMVLRIAREHDLTVYNALYLELALRLSCPLATLDQELAMAAVEAGGAVFSADA